MIPAHCLFTLFLSLPAASGSDPGAFQPKPVLQLIKEASWLEHQRDFHGAAELLAQALRQAESAAPGNQHLVDIVTYELVYAYQLSGESDRAIEVLEPYLASRQEALGPDHPEIGQLLLALSNTLYERKRYYDAEPHVTRALRIARGRQDRELEAAALNMLGALQTSLRDIDGADRSLSAALALQQQAGLPENPLSVELLHNVAVVRAAQGRAADAEGFFKHALAMGQRVFPAGQPQVGWTVRAYAALLRRTKRKKEARELERTLEVR